jgi:hypothetical protein
MKKPLVSYRLMNILVIIAGFIGISLLFLPDGELLTLFLTLAVLGSLLGGGNTYTETDRQLLKQSYKLAFEWLLLVILVAYTVIESSIWFGALKSTATFLNDYWPVLVFSFMCILMGIAGFQRQKQGM